MRRRLSQTPVLHGEGGFTLIEVLVSVAVLSILVAGLVSLLLEGAESARDGSWMMIAVNLAEGKVEELRRADFTSVTSTGATPFAGFPEFSWQAAVTDRSLVLKEVTVTVSWTNKGRIGSTSITTLIFNFTQTP